MSGYNWILERTDRNEREREDFQLGKIFIKRDMGTVLKIFI